MTTDAETCCCLCSGAAKYRCPSCDRQTCSLSCVTAHKLRFSCSGRRGCSYVPISEMTTETLVRDIALLDDAARVIESTTRAFVQRQLEAAASASKRVKIGALRRCCAERDIQLVACPPMLSRHLKNYTSVRKNNVYWTVDWHFAQKDVVLFERRVNERATLAQALERAMSRLYSDPQNAELLSEYFLLGNLAVLLKDLDSPAKHPHYFQCDMDDTIRHNLAHTKILEFPRFNVTLKKDLHLYTTTERRRLLVKEIQDVTEEGEGATATDADHPADDIAIPNMHEHCGAEGGIPAMESTNDDLSVLDAEHN